MSSCRVTLGQVHHNFPLISPSDDFASYWQFIYRNDAEERKMHPRRCRINLPEATSKNRWINESGRHENLCFKHLRLCYRRVDVWWKLNLSLRDVTRFLLRTFNFKHPIAIKKKKRKNLLFTFIWYVVAAIKFNWDIICLSCKSRELWILRDYHDVILSALRYRKILLLY